MPGAALDGPAGAWGVVMSDDVGEQAQPWASLAWEDYHTEVVRLSAYPEEHRKICARAGMVAELGELLGLFDLRRVAKKGPPSREAVRAELGDVLWYAALYSTHPWGFDGWGDPDPAAGMALHVTDIASAVDCVVVILGVMRVVSGDEPFLYDRAGALCQRLGFSPQEVAFYNLEKLRARREAGTLHDREARGGAGGGV